MNGPRDELGELLIQKGLVPNQFILDLNRSLTVPHDMELPAPWNLPSRLFRFPIEVSEFSEDSPRRIGLIHPLLVEHPFVQRVAAELAMELDPNGAPNDCGVSKQGLGQWWHAIDLISAGHWRELLETRRFTTDEAIAASVSYGLSYSRHDAARRCGHISVSEAREIMREIGSAEPADRAAILRGFDTPRPVKQESGSLHWPINCTSSLDAERRAWGHIFGIEAGWFNHDRQGFLTWTELGRARFEGGSAPTFIETTGQAAFAF